jgi:hypothetical protein
MTRRASDLPLRKVTLNLYDEDMDLLKRVYGNGKVAEAIQKVVHNHVQVIKYHIAASEEQNDD